MLKSETTEAKAMKEQTAPHWLSCLSAQEGWAPFVHLLTHNVGEFPCVDFNQVSAPTSIKLAMFETKSLVFNQRSLTGLLLSL